MKIDEYPYNNESLLENLIEFSRLVETIIFGIGNRELKIEVYEEPKLLPKRYQYKLYERKEIEKQSEKVETWIFQSNFPFDSAESPNEALGAALRWVKEYYSPKK